MMFILNMKNAFPNVCKTHKRENCRTMPDFFSLSDSRRVYAWLVFLKAVYLVASTKEVWGLPRGILFQQQWFCGQNYLPAAGWKCFNGYNWLRQIHDKSVAMKNLMAFHRECQRFIFSWKAWRLIDFIGQIMCIVVSKKERLAAAGGNFIARSLNYQKFEPILRFALVSGQHNASANTWLFESHHSWQLLSYHMRRDSQ